MFLHLPNLVSPNHLTEIITLLQQASFMDGKRTASGAAQQVKANLQLSREDETSKRVSSYLEAALQVNPLFREFIIPKVVLPFLVSRYEAGMQYGWHVDSPVMFAHPVQLRTDVSMTVFLNKPSDYEGGELEIESDSGLQLFKLAAGDAILYPTTRVHRVRPVTSGQRIVAVTWVQSLVRDPVHRETLYQLKRLHDILAQKQLGSEEHLISQQVHSNLLRSWAEM